MRLTKNCMKRNALKLSLALFLAVLLTMAVILPVSAVSKDGSAFLNAFFKNGVSKPTVYMAEYDNNDGSSVNGSIQAYYVLPADIMAANLAYSRYYDAGDDNEFNKAYGIYDYSYWVQLDIKVDNGDWMYVPEWDDCDMWNVSGSWVYPVQNDIAHLSNWPLQKFYDAYVVGMGENYPDLVKSYINGYDEEVFHYDLTNHTIYFRARAVLVVYLEGEDEPIRKHSDWTATASIGKGGSQKAPTKPSKLPTPVISDLTIVPDPANISSPVMTWYLSNSTEFGAAMIWAEENGKSVYLEGETQVDGSSEWVAVEVINNWDIYDGRLSSWEVDALHSDCMAVTHFRYVVEGLGASDWSPAITLGAQYCTHPSYGTWHTCSEDNGLCEKICTVCGYKFTQSHTYGDGVVKKAATCATPGERIYLFHLWL